MVDVTVDAAVGNEPEKMQAGIVGQHVVHRFVQFRICKEGTVFDRIGDQGQILVDHTAGTDVEVPDFTVAHLAVRQADRFAAAQQLGGGVGIEKMIQIRLFCQADRIACTGRCFAEAIEDHQHSRSFSKFHMINNSLSVL